MISLAASSMARWISSMTSRFRSAAASAYSRRMVAMSSAVSFSTARTGWLPVGVWGVPGPELAVWPHCLPCRDRPQEVAPHSALQNVFMAASHSACWGLVMAPTAWVSWSAPVVAAMETFIQLWHRELR
jgi:hypothetical protein